MTVSAERIYELTSQLVSLRTDETEAEAQHFLHTVLGACGFDCRLQEIAPGRLNLVARRGDGGTFVCSHVDTHPPHAHPEPFRCRRQGDVLVGRGALDAKGQIAALMAAVEEERHAPVLIAITCDEEGRGLGSERLDLPDGPWHSDGGVVLEPTAFRVCTAQAGHIDVSVEVSGTPGHTYASQKSGSPIAAVLAAADALETCGFLSNRHELLPAPRVHIGVLEGGEHLWRRPARARIELGIGFVPGTDFPSAQNEVRSRLEDIARRWDARGTSFLYEVVDASEAIEVGNDLPVATRLARAMDSPLQPAGMPSWTDAGNLLTKHGIPCVVFGAGDLAAAHSDYESVKLDDLIRLAQVLRKLLVTPGGTAR